jgi:nucleoside-diphosphate-sugar epimerase
VFNVGGGREISLLQLVRLVEETVGRKAEVDFQAARPFDAPRVLLDTRLAEDELDWRPTVSLQEGLARTWHWMSQELSM